MEQFLFYYLPVGGPHKYWLEFNSEASLMKAVEDADRGVPVITDDKGTRIVMKNVVSYTYAIWE